MTASGGSTGSPSRTQAQPSGPVGSGEYVVQPGDSISSLAYERGLLWNKIWNHPENAELKRVRKNPSILLPGDRLHIPEIEVKTVQGITEKRHRFVRKGVPEVLKLVVKREGNPVANESYRLVVDGKTFTGTTDGEGRIEARIDPNAKSASLGVGTDNYHLQLGHVDPISEITGIQGRLRNLGFDCGEIDGEMNEATSQAVRAFQLSQDLEPSGELDDRTRDALVAAHGS